MTANNIYLSKSDFLKYEVCPSYLWLWKYKHEVVPIDEAEDIERRLEQGNEVEKYARKLFNEGVLVSGTGVGAKVNTEQLVTQKTKTIFQAQVITDDGLLAIADVITTNDNAKSWTLYEVKSTNSIKKEHIIDVAFQKVAFEEAGYNISDVGVIYLNKDYLMTTQINPKDFFIIEDISERVDKIAPTIKQQIHDAIDLLRVETEPKGCSCRLKSKSGHCPTFHYLNPDIPEYSVFNISRIGGKNLGLLIDGEIYNVDEVPDDIKLSVIQKNQVDVAKSKKPIIDTSAIQELFSELEYPLYFLDYETVSTAIPLYIGCKPFQQIPFQYSLHVLREPDGEIEHYEYLGKDGSRIPVEELLDSLSNNIGNAGSVVVWSKSFESNRNKEMGKTYNKYADFLDNINNRIFDLMEVFTKQHFVHHKFNGSSSIKAVLPVLVPEFSYKELGIQNGMTAAIRWYDAVTGAISKQESQKVFDDLIKYCCLDTLAMVKIYDYLKNI